MKRLFIIGNGFDLAHGIHSSYEDFRKYLVFVDIKELSKNFDGIIY